jgi:hypothetical protein
MKKYEKLLYQANGLSYVLAMFFLIFNTYQTIVTLNGIDVVEMGVLTAEIILLNIVLSFLAFIVAFEMRRYSLKWSCAGLALGVFECARVFFLSKSIAETSALHVRASLLAAGLLLIAASAFACLRARQRRTAAAEEVVPCLS